MRRALALALVLGVLGCSALPLGRDPAVAAEERLLADGERHLAAGQAPAAARAFRDALRRFPRSPRRDRALYGLGLALAHPGAEPREYREARAAFDRLVREDPASPRVADALAWRSVLEAYLERADQLERLRRLDAEMERSRRP